MIHTLSNGLRVALTWRDSDVTWCGFAVGAGSRDEQPGHYGLAHFVEHTLFKGTTHRRAWHILNRMERVGGELNAYTTKEETMIYSIFAGVHLERAIELMADLVCNSVFPVDELMREKDVVLEEVASYLDVPSDAIYDDFEDLIFGDTAMGHNVLGCEKDLRALTQQHCLDYLHRLYTPDNMVLYAVGRIDENRLLRLAEKHLGGLQRTLQRMPRAMGDTPAPQRREMKLGCHQAHTIVGTRLPGMYDERRFALALLNNMLGGPGMNSLLNVQLRERRGYVYTVESTYTAFSDCGLMEIYLGCDHSDVRSSLRVIDRITASLASTRLSDRRLEAAKRQYCGQMMVAADSAEFTAMNLGKNVLYYDNVSTIADAIERIRSVTADQVRDAAQLITSDHLSQLTFV